MSLMRPDPNPIGHLSRGEHLSPLPIKTLEKITFFKKTGNLVLYKKSERICAAIFVVSDGVESSTLRERLRAEALSLFTGVRDSIARRGSLVPADANGLSLAAASLVSVLELACRIGEVTESNYSLLRQECLRLAESLADVASLAGDHLDPRIFDSGLRELEPQVRQPRPVPQRPVSYKGHVKDTPKPGVPQMSFKGSARQLIESLGASVESREAKIMDVVRANVRVSIKDITDAMPEVGEKTIQRALVSMVSRGVLKKEGERRWSRYSAVGAAPSA